MENVFYSTIQIKYLMLPFKTHKVEPLHSHSLVNMRKQIPV